MSEQTLTDQGLAEPVSELVDCASRLALHGHVVAGLVQGQSSAIDQTRKLASDMRESVEEVAAAAQQSAATAVTGHDAATHGESLMNVMLEQLTSAATIAEAAETELGELLERVRRVAEVAAKIDRIADQTKLLALNASIEAARAGAEGAGFGVVAQEVGRLAQAGAEAVDAVSAIMTDATQQAERAAAAGTEIRSAATSAIEHGREAGEQFAEIATCTAALKTIAVDVAGAAVQQAVAAGHLDAAADGIAAIAESTVESSLELGRTVRDVENSTGRLGGHIAALLHEEAESWTGPALAQLHMVLAPVLDVPRSVAAQVIALSRVKKSTAERLSSADVRDLDPLFRQTLMRMGGAVLNVGAAFAPGRLSDCHTQIRAWGATPNGIENVSAENDPDSPDYFDYAATEWYADAVARGGSSLLDPQFHHTVQTVVATASFPIHDDEGVLGLAWSDLDLTHLHRLCAPALARVPPAAVVTSTGIVVASNDEQRFAPGEALDGLEGFHLVRSPALEWQLATPR